MLVKYIKHSADVSFSSPPSPPSIFISETIVSVVDVVVTPLVDLGGVEQKYKDPAKDERDVGREGRREGESVEGSGTLALALCNAMRHCNMESLIMIIAIRLDVSISKMRGVSGCMRLCS